MSSGPKSILVLRRAASRRTKAKAASAKVTKTEIETLMAPSFMVAGEKPASSWITGAESTGGSWSVNRPCHLTESSQIQFDPMPGFGPATCNDESNLLGISLTSIPIALHFPHPSPV
uniref:Uncharacterized protein n=1 Tax=Fusarium oxysporum (strain Fo5176) TaxID=660025 RepID=A0A0D2YDF6_FUSOF